jgi:hypothetical protein
VDHVVPDAGTEVTKGILARDMSVQASQLSVAASFVCLEQIAAEVRIVDVMIHFGCHFQNHEAGGVVAAIASGAIMGGREGAGETEVQGGTDEPTEAAVDIALRCEGDGMRGELVV